MGETATGGATGAEPRGAPGGPAAAGVLGYDAW
jgi:hypothetical protein